MHLRIGSNLSMKLAREQEDAKAMAWAILDRVNHGDDIGLNKQEFHDTVTWALKQTGDL